MAVPMRPEWLSIHAGQAVAGRVFLPICFCLHALAAAFYLTRFMQAPLEEWQRWRQRGDPRYRLARAIQPGVKWRPISLVVALLSGGLALLYAREMKWVPQATLAVVLFAGFFVGVLHLVSIWSIESQRHR